MLMAPKACRVANVTLQLCGTRDNRTSPEREVNETRRSQWPISRLARFGKAEALLLFRGQPLNIATDLTISTSAPW